MLCLILINKAKKTKKRENIKKRKEIEKEFFTCCALAYFCIKFKSIFFKKPLVLHVLCLILIKKAKKTLKRKKEKIQRDEKK